MDRRRNSSQKSRPQESSGTKSPSTPTPAFLTSFPSFSPPEVSRSRRRPSSSESTPTSVDSKRTGYRAVSSSNTAKKTTTSTKMPDAGPGVATSAMNRTVQAAVNLRKTIMDSITSRSASGTQPQRIFSGFEAAGDPLLNATDEHINRIITSSGGAVATVKKYSADLAEANERVAAERNSKLKLVEENRELRAELRDKEQEIEALHEQLEIARKLFERYVERVRPGDAPKIRFLDSPTGPYVFEDSTGTILSTINDEFVYPDSNSITSEPPEMANDIPDDLAITVTNVKSMDTIRPKRTKPPPKLPQRLVSAIKSEFVELKSPVDINLLPPALRADGSSPNEALVDRLGFYITPDREKRHQEAAAANRINIVKRLDDDANSESSSIHSSIRDQDDEGEGSSIGGLSSSELLCDAPAGPPTKLIFRSESSMRVFIEVDKGSGKSSESGTTMISTPVNTTTAAAELSAPSSAASKLTALFNNNNQSGIQEKSNALNSLLLKLNQAYDLQQQKRSAEWTSFYEQTRDFIALQRARSSSNPTGTSSLDENDVSGMTALCGASHMSPEIRATLNGLIRRGVPVSLRREVWLERSGANNIRDPELYHALLDLETDKEGEDAYALHEIAVDVERTLGTNVFFREGPGKDRLRDVLVAFARHNPEIGYSQGLNIIAANLLLVVPGPEDGFALLEALVKDILPSEYYSRDGRISSAALERDGRVAEGYVNEVFPILARHMRSLVSGSSPSEISDTSSEGKGALSLTMFTPGWFISAFAACVNGEPLYRLWDLLFGFCDGRFVFSFALALIRMNRRGLMACRSQEELMSYLGSGKMSAVAVGLDELVGETVRISERVVTKVDLARRRKSTEKMIAAELGISERGID